MPQKTIYILTERVWKLFADKCKSRGESMSGVISLLIDAYNDKPEEVINLLKSLKK